jgi:polyphenol oxidase
MALPGLSASVPAFVPDWHLPAGVKALQTECGRGPPPYGGFNLGDHVGDDIAQVTKNRQTLVDNIGMAPVWMRQVHGTRVLEINGIASSVPEADAAMTSCPSMACTIMTADCLPVLVADQEARVVGAAHAGWRGLADGVVEQLIDALCRVPGVAPRDLSVWLGPAIGPMAFEVGQDVVDAFIRRDTAHAAAFRVHPGSAGKYLADIAVLATHILRARGVEDITPSGLCTFTLTDRFYSYRRDGVTGRMASLIWLE